MLSLNDGVELWTLLAAIVRNKIGRQVERHIDAARRSVDAEHHFGSADSLHTSVPKASEPSTEEAIAMADELDALLHDVEQTLGPEYRRAAELWLSGASLKESEESLNRGDRWISRAREKIRAAGCPPIRMSLACRYRLPE